jgi:hypothetical protein
VSDSLKTTDLPWKKWLPHRFLPATAALFTILSIFLIGILVCEMGIRWSRDDERQELATALAQQNKLPADQKAEEGQEKLREQRFDQQERMLDKLATITGIFTLILAGAAYAGLSQTKAKAEAEISALSTKADADITLIHEKVDRIRADIPSIYALNRRIEDVLYVIQSKLPPEENWGLPNAYKRLTAGDRQKILLCEMKIAAIGMFDIQNSPQMRQRTADIYLAMARFYLVRSEQEARREIREEDQARVVQYLEHVTDLQDAFPSAVAHRLRGVMLMQNYQKEKAEPKPDPERLAALLEEMKRYLRKSKDTDENEAGAWYNLANVYGLFENKPLAAIEELTRLLNRRDKVQEIQRGKFLPDAAINLACYHLRYAASIRTRLKPAQERKHEADALEACRLGKKLAREYCVSEAFAENLEGELGGDLLPLARFYPGEVKKILDPTLD